MAERDLRHRFLQAFVVVAEVSPVVIAGLLLSVWLTVPRPLTARMLSLAVASPEQRQKTDPATVAENFFVRQWSPTVAAPPPPSRCGIFRSAAKCSSDRLSPCTKE